MLLNNTKENIVTQMKKVYINVTKYANENALTLEQAHKEIQPFLFSLGYNWKCLTYNKKVSLCYAEYLELHMEEDWAITQCSSESFTETDYDYNWELERKVSLRYVHRAITSAKEYVEFNGKQYEKAKLEQALKLIEGDHE
jgi:hypothetical protein